jgi:hypothetical protein
MTCLEEDESCLDILESQENPTSRTALYQTKAMMHKWQHLTGAEVEHNHRPGQSRRMPSWYRVDKDAVSLPILRSLRK